MLDKAKLINERVKHHDEDSDLDNIEQQGHIMTASPHLESRAADDGDRQGQLLTGQRIP